MTDPISRTPQHRSNLRVPRVATSPVHERSFTSVLREIARADRTLDGAVARARAGGTLSNGELILLQADVYRATLAIDLAGKVVDKMTQAISRTLSPQS